MSRWRGLLVVGAVVLVAGCGGISSTELEDEAQARGGGLGATLPLEAIDAIEESTGEPVRFTSLTMSLNSVSLNVLVPGSDDELDSYQYRSGGPLRGPEPVSGAPEAQDLRRQLINPDNIALDDLDELIDDAIEVADLPDGYAQNVSIRKPSPGMVTITVTVANERDTASVTFRGNGERIEPLR